MPFDPIKPPTIGSTLAREILPPGSRIGAYEVGELLSFGMAGGVYRAAVHNSGEPCTLWVMPSLLGANRDFRKRLQSMLPNLGTLTQPSILTYKRMEWDGQRACLEMDAFDGLSLERVLLDAPDHAWPPLKTDVLARLLSGIAEAMGAAHARSLTHHNLVPANVLMQPDGTAKVFGFGLVEALGREVYQALASAAVPPVRTPELDRTLQSTEMRAPEVQAGKPATRATDIYYFGVLAYFLLTGKRYTHGSPPPSELRPTLDKKWDNLVGRCLNPNPSARPVNAPRLAQDLANMEQMEEVPGSVWGGDAEITRSRRFRLARERRQLMILGGAGLLLLLGLGIAASFLLQGGEPEPDGPPPVVRAEPSEPANLTLHISPAGAATVRFSGAGAGKLSAPGGQLRARIPAGDYRVVVELPDHAPAPFILNMGAETQERSVELEPLTANLRLRTVGGAHVFAVADGRELYVASAGPDGLADLSGRLLAREQALRVRAKGYAEQELKLALQPGDNDMIDVPLAALGVPVTVLAATDGVQIYIDDALAGEAPLRLESVLPGTPVRLRAVAGGYRPSERVLDLQPGQAETVDFGELEPQTGTLQVAVSFAQPNTTGTGAIVTVDGREVDAAAPLEFSVGSHTVRVEHPDLLPAEAAVDVPDGSSVRLPVALQPRPGALRLEVVPQVSLTVLLDGKPAPSGPVVEIPPGREVTLELQAQDFLTIRQTLRMRPNERRDLRLELQPIPGPQAGSPWVLPYLDEPFAWLPAGRFLMGSPNNEVDNRPNESPQTRASFSRGFWIMPHEVRQSLWTQLMESNPSEYKGPDLPVHNVSWQDAVEFCKRLSGRERKAGRLPAGYVYRLPTEAEWEYAARAGTATPFSFGSEAGAGEGNFRGSYPPNRSGGTVSASQNYGPVAVASYPANAWGLYDMHGNVAEWCVNIFNSRLPGGSVEDWKGPADGRDHPVRGGHWSDFASRARSAARERLSAETRSPVVGFRAVLAPDL